MRVSYAESVFEELVDHSFYLAESDEELAQRFLNSCDETFSFLSRNKLAGSMREFQDPRLAEVRMWRVKGFEKYLIFYIPTDAGVTILHVLHSATDYDSLFLDEQEQS